MQKGNIHLIYVIIIIAAVVGFFLVIRQTPKLQPTPHQTMVTPKLEKTSLQATDSAQIQQAKLEKYLTVEAALLGVKDNISLSFKDPARNMEVNIEPTRQWIPASTIKAFVVLEAFRQRDLGLIDFDKEITISASNVVPTELESDEFPRLREGTKTTIYQLVEAMIIQSDNIAYNTLLDILDRRNINLALRNIGITETVVGEKLNLDETQFQQDLQVPGRQSNTTTSNDLAILFDLLYNKKIAHSEEILAIFKRQKINNMIPQFLPSNTVVAHKTGDWAPIYHDSGVIFKPDNPFILTILTNSGDPKVVAEMAKVAYFQTAQSVSQDINQNSKPVSFGTTKKSNQLITLVKLPNNAEVLAAETPEKFPEITASDLGITPKDLNPSLEQVTSIRQAIITPGSIFYGLKQFLEDQQLKNAQSNSDKVKAHLNLAKARLSEVKRLLTDGNLTEADNLLNQSENHLAQAVELAEKDQNRDLLLVGIKQINDLHFAVLADRGKSLPSGAKEQFVDSVYNFYQNNQKNVEVAIKASAIANPIQQKPAIGEITQIDGNEATLKFDDGTQKQIILAPDTKVRSFQQDTYQDINSVKLGDKVAVVGLTNRESKVVPQFILKDVPKELPQKHTGTVIEINPDEKTLKILDKKGELEIINVFDNTFIKAKDTSVSLEGIKAGSQVTIFGTTTSPKPSSQSVTNPTSQPNSASESDVSPKSGSSQTTSQTTNQTTVNPPSTVDQTANQNTSKSSTVEIKATSITVTKNSSGSQEKVESKPVQPQKAPQPAHQSAKPQESTKVETKNRTK